eukprot:Nk52_evm10s309 gene=Nk52_evmTU10s309
MEGELICNYAKCRKPLNTTAWVTSCSHIFCDEDGSREFDKGLVCPACNTNLPQRFDIVKVQMNPDEAYKSMVLAGLRPEYIMEVCNRALSFWNYQSFQQKCYFEHQASRCNAKVAHAEQKLRQMSNALNEEKNANKMKIAEIQKETENWKGRCREASDKLNDKSRQHQKLQMMYDGLRRQLTSGQFAKQSGSNSGAPYVAGNQNSNNGDRGYSYMDAFDATAPGVINPRSNQQGIGLVGYTPTTAARSPGMQRSGQFPRSPSARRINSSYADGSAMPPSTPARGGSLTKSPPSVQMDICQQSTPRSNLQTPSRRIAGGVKSVYMGLQGTPSVNSVHSQPPRKPSRAPPIRPHTPGSMFGSRRRQG